MAGPEPFHTIVFDGPEGVSIEVTLSGEPSDIDEEARTEAHDWLATDEEDLDYSRADPSLAEALTVTAMFTYAVSGCVGNYAYDLFPNVADLLKRLRRCPALPDADAAARVAVEHALRHYGRSGESVSLEKIRQREDGSWRAVARLSSGTLVKVLMSPGGSIVESRHA